jgi:hypothetical protein
MLNTSIMKSVAIVAIAFSLPTLADNAKVSFANDIVPLLNTRCVVCHLTGTEAGKLSLAPKVAFSNLVNVPSNESQWLRVKPGSPEGSYLMMKLDGTQLDHGGKGAQMPFGGPVLDSSTLDLIRQWISVGAPNN